VRSGCARSDRTDRPFVGGGSGFGGTIDKVTGDGLMAVFGAPVALEDHALRSCLAALDIRREVGRLGGEDRARDGVELQLRIGLNSGQVIAGEMGSGPMSYMLSESTARLVGDAVTLAEAETVRIKSAQSPVSARRLLAGAPDGRRRTRQAPTLEGRHWELSTIGAMLDQSANRKGRVVGLVGPPGIGKSRMAGAVVEHRERQGEGQGGESRRRHRIGAAGSRLPLHIR
jgi:adenylate cyclase